MPITEEQIKQNEGLAGLTPDQVTAIITLSKNVEDQVIGEKVREIHTQYDQDIKEITGLDKPGGVKTYDHLKTILQELYTGAQGGKELADKVKALEEQKTALEEKIKAGKGNEELTAQLQDLQRQVKDRANQVAALQAQIKEEADKAAAAIAQAEQGKNELLVGMEFSKATEGVTFKDLPKEVLNTYLESAKREILSQYKTDFTDGPEGAKKMVFRDSAGNIVGNPKNLQNPITAAELYLQKIAPVIAENKTGAGTDAAGKGGGNSAPLDITQAKTKTEATRILSQQLAKQGLVKGTPEFSEALAKAYTETGANKLPVQ